MKGDDLGGTSGAWEREGFHLRLSKARKAGLARIAERLPNATPTAAVDLAIELALGAQEAADADSGSAEKNRLAALEESIERLASERRLESEASGARIEEIAEGLERLADLISDALSDPSSEDANGCSPALGDWIGSEVAARGLALPRVALVRADWMSSSRDAAGQLRMSFDVGLAYIDEELMPVPLAATARVHFGPVGVESELARIAPGEPICFACQPTAEGLWRVAPFRMEPDGSVGQRIRT